MAGFRIDTIHLFPISLHSAHIWIYSYPRVFVYVKESIPLPIHLAGLMKLAKSLMRCPLIQQLLNAFGYQFMPFCQKALGPCKPGSGDL